MFVPEKLNFIVFVSIKRGRLPGRGTLMQVNPQTDWIGS